ncbi:MmgE/PrpD family protein [Rhodococcoides fascians]|uniref:MmgE/PrpD family protein n=1 Tax=Rhodococcoides fascians TaxID=1828 RepID=UPI0037896032
MTVIERTADRTTLVEYLIGQRWSDLSSLVTERTKMLIFDQLGCAFVGAELPSGRLALQYAGTLGESRESSIAHSSRTMAAVSAAYVNGTAGHAAELDCAHATTDFRATGHPATVIVPAAVAVAERQCSSGAELIGAVAAGFEAGARTISAVGGLSRMRSEHGLYAGCLHSIGAAVASARLLGLDADTTMHAAALTVGQAISPVAFFGERRHISKSITKGGQPATAGVAGALQAAAGLEGVDNIFGAPGGIVDTWGEPGRESALTDRFGEDHAVLGANFKFYAAGYPIHSAVEAALGLLADHGLSAQEVLSASVGMPAFAASVVDSRNMPTICMQDMLSVAMVAGRLGFEEAHSGALLEHPQVSRLRKAVTVYVDDELEREQPQGRGSRVTLRTESGELSRLIEHPRGHRFRENNVTWDLLLEKWQPMLEPRMGAGRFGELVTTAMGLEGVDDVRSLTGTLTG